MPDVFAQLVAENRAMMEKLSAACVERDRLREALGELAEAAREFTTQAEYAVEESYEDDLMGCISQAEELVHPADPKDSSA